MTHHKALKLIVIEERKKTKLVKSIEVVKKMSCGLSDNELFILNILYKNRNFASNRGQHCKKLEDIFERKYPPQLKFEKSIKSLLNKGYITQIRKKEIKYYISDIKITSFALGSHGYSVVNGRVRPL